MKQSICTMRYKCANELECKYKIRQTNGSYNANLYMDCDDFVLDEGCEVKNILNSISIHSTCKSRQVGAVIHYGKHILGIGYNGSPNTIVECTECERKKLGIKSGELLEQCKAIHAEQRAILHALSTCTSIRNATLTCTTFPCTTCAKLLIQVGIKEINYLEEYSEHDELAIKLLTEARVSLVKLERD